FYHRQSIKNININGYFYCGKNCDIQENVSLKNVVLWDNVKLETGTLLEDVIVTDEKVVSGIHKGKIL
ncbi:hypothetical protein J7L67_04700, partial [bacterium]|nr:hypothetical protein [bacterium]